MSRLYAALFLVALLGSAVGQTTNSVSSDNYRPPGGGHDPQFRGLDGRTFYFDGVPGKIFNIITEQDHQLNALFSEGPHKIDNLGVKSNGTYMTTFGLQMYQTQVEMSINEEGDITASVNGDSVDEDLTQGNHFTLSFEEPYGVTVTVEKYRVDYGYAITVQSALFEFILYSTPKQYDPVVQEIGRAHLNFEMAANIEALSLTKCHGVLGQTAIYSDSALLPEELSTAFLGEGKDEDYAVSSLFGTDFTYNLFGKKSIVKAGSGENPSLGGRATSKMSAARRYLREGQNAIVYAPFAMGGRVK